MEWGCEIQAAARRAPPFWFDDTMMGRDGAVSRTAFYASWMEMAWKRALFAIFG